MNRHFSLLYACIFYNYVCMDYIHNSMLHHFLGLKIHCSTNRTNIFKSTETVHTWEKKIKREFNHLLHVVISDIPMLIQSSNLTDIQLLCSTEGD